MNIRGTQSIGTFPGFTEFVAMMAGMMALYAGAIDTMLPAVPAIGRDFSVANPNSLQWIIAGFIMGAGGGQLVYGPLSDRFGRRPVLLGGLALYSIASLAAMTATGLPSLLALRATQGFVAASANVLSRSIVRDRYSGDAMARVSSIIFMVFLMVPVLAPSLGQILLFYMSWRGIFGCLALLGVCVTTWVAVRLPETLAPAARQPLSAAHLARAAWFVVSEPTSILYTLAVSFLYGALLAYVSTVPQIFNDAFHRPRLMAVTFAVGAGTMGLASFLNSRIVMRIGMHQVSHFALMGFICITLMHTIVAWFGGENVLVFSLFQAATMGFFGLAVSNFGAIAMQPMGEIAGSAASVQGVITTIGGALIGSAIGHQWTSSVTFLPAGSFACGLVALVCVLFAEKAQMFKSRVDRAAFP
jgi:DHA1 family bicyclomycin/chloramphenicol resistance-like MFS transporter